MLGFSFHEITSVLKKSQYSVDGSSNLEILKKADERLQ